MLHSCKAVDISLLENSKSQSRIVKGINSKHFIRLDERVINAPGRNFILCVCGTCPATMNFLLCEESLINVHSVCKMLQIAGFYINITSTGLGYCRSRYAVRVYSTVVRSFLFIQLELLFYYMLISLSHTISLWKFDISQDSFVLSILSLFSLCCYHCVTIEIQMAAADMVGLSRA